MAATKMLQKLLSSMDLPEDAVGKLVELQKSMFDSGASLNDIANLMQMVLDQGSSAAAILDPHLMSLLKEELSPEDLERLSNAIEGFASAKLSPELTGKLMQLQTAVEAGIISPEKSAEAFLDLLKSPNSSALLKDKFMNMMNENEITREALDKGAMVQAAVTASKLSSQDLQTVFELQNALLTCGLLTPQQVADVFQSLLQGVDTKSVSKAMAASFEHKRMKEEDVASAADIARALQASKLKGVPTRSDH